MEEWSPLCLAIMIGPLQELLMKDNEEYYDGENFAKEKVCIEYERIGSR